MSCRRPLPILCLAFLAAMAHLTDASASEHRRDRERERGGERTLAERGMSLDEAVARAERQYKARVVRAEEKRRGDRIEYRIRLLGEDGRVFEVRVDAGSGRED